MRIGTKAPTQSANASSQIRFFEVFTSLKPLKTLSALNPNNYQPSGYLNFSEINDFMLIFNFEDNLQKSTGCSTNGLIKVYCVNYNILQINSGQGSLLYYLD